MIFFDIDQRSPDWHQIKLGVLSASDAYKIVCGGKGLETLCQQKVAEILTGESSNHFINDDIQRGIDLEHEARLAYELATGLKTKTVGFVKPTKNALIGCSPDLWIIDQPGLVEIKSRNDVNHLKRILDLPIDKEGECQMNMQMRICERKFCDYVSYNPHYMVKGKELVIKRIYPDPQIQEKLEINLDKGEKMIKEMLNSVLSSNTIRI